MDNEIPLPDELEWLEATSRFHEDNLHPSSPDFYPYPYEDERSPSLDPQINGPKRPRQSDSQNSLDLEHTIGLDHPKRSKVDEDWLRHSPVREEDGEEEIVELVLEEKEEEEEKVEEERILSRYASEIDGEFFPVTAPSGGDRVYAKVSRVWKEGDRCRNLCLKSQFHGEVLTSEPIDVLLRRVEQEAFTKALHASSEIQSDAVCPETHVAHERLWVDKYAPNSFTELLSDEQSNREVLLWLKQWDETVFGSEIRSTSDEVLSALRRHSSAVHKKSSDSSFLKKNRGDIWNNGNVRSSSNVSDHTNSHSKGIQELQKSKLTGPPEQKILLLCGPPGLGKTTLAHVAAKHCGYRVVEVNASDDRSTSAIEAKILDVVQMNSVIADSRPKCLVIDEIDGALADGKGAVEVVLKMVSGDRKSNNGKENFPSGEQTGRISSKKGHKTASLLRPVINDSKYYIDVKCKESKNNEWWNLTMVHAESMREYKEEGWQKLSQVIKARQDPWLCMGDFNAICYSHEKQSKNPIDRAQSQSFHDFINAGDLLDLGYKGNPYTWSNKQEGANSVMERIDRGLANPSWRNMFSKAQVIHEMLVGSDHTPIILLCELQGFKPGRTFKFEAMWTTNPECRNVIARAWKQEINGSASYKLYRHLVGCRQPLKRWSKNNFGNNKHQIRELTKNLDQLQEQGHTSGSKAEEHKIKQEINKLWSLEEMYWHQRSRVNWLNYGDRNTKFFHTTATERRQRNHIVKIKDQEGNWLEEDD